ncbi:peptidoglycan editing factor PgeF [Anaerobacillus alkaliphilus]|uniref:peptidoglycan editing factor PgeF n=1 Tax=Anaerobacillus alkaliphilus TaxID=1548597 RepID=UPI001F500C9A|nr:peptidoglycan editing factor PgeF [Anaerobacillus alkaliphilus]
MREEPFVSNNKLFLSVEPFKQVDDNLVVGFSTRINGKSTDSYSSLNMGLHVQDNVCDVIANREALAAELGIPLSNWVFADQVHGNNIKKVCKEDVGAGSLSLETAVKDTDGLYTREKNVLLASLYADCVPLYFYSTSANIVGLAHAGWKGTVGEIGPKMIRIWVEDEKIPLETIYVAIGPSISQRCYEVDDYVIDRVRKIVQNENLAPYKEIATSKYLLDLKELNKQLLLNMGVNANHIFTSNYCTFNEKALFFSYRREQKTGRMMSFIGRV